MRQYDRTQMFAHAVIRQAVLDLFSKTLSGSHEDDQDADRYQAMRFLTARDGEWRQAREDWCAMADVDADDLRMHIIDILNGHRTVEFPPDDKTYRLNGQDIARQVWAAEKQRHITYIEDAKKLIAERRMAQSEARMRLAWDDATRTIEQANLRLRYAT